MDLYLVQNCHLVIFMCEANLVFGLGPHPVQKLILVFIALSN